MNTRVAFLTAAALTLSASAALGNVIDPATDKAAAKLRADIGKQVSKYTFCLVKAATTCEKKGTSSAPECNLATGAVSFEPMPGDVTTKFQAAIAKCDDKLVPEKKSTDPVADYLAIGCPGDCGAAAGTQQCADLNAFEANVEATTGATAAKVQLGTLAGAIDFACGMDTGAGPTEEARIDCAAAQSKLLSKVGQTIFKCQAKCENDFKASKGDGGPTNAANCLALDPGADPAFNDCVNKGLSKVTPSLSPTVASVVLPLVVLAVNDATDGLYNRADPTGSPSDSPCGTCGNGTREGAEECDLADDLLCGGPCNADCTCP